MHSPVLVNILAAAGYRILICVNRAAGERGENIK
jgi:hypothetical protein